MKILAFYKDMIKKLRVIAVDEVESVEQAQQLVHEQLEADSEVFSKPILFLIQGGRK